MAEINLFMANITPRMKFLWRKCIFYGEKSAVEDPGPAIFLCRPPAPSCLQIEATLRQCVAGQTSGRERLPVQLFHQILIQRFDCGLDKIEQRSGFLLDEPAVDRSYDRMSASRRVVAQEQRQQGRSQLTGHNIAGATGLSPQPQAGSPVDHVVCERQYQQPGEFDHGLLSFEFAGEAIVAWRAENIIEAAKIQNLCFLLCQSCFQPRRQNCPYIELDWEELPPSALGFLS